ncbi:hypothetical protein HMPREF0388_0064 [Mobiluncus curtisii ATCC 51333]|uniref:Uncharacterized protein n=1 Tax=Mobiluncus curtisii ATCC 51333 TaxID=887326 RepID=E6LW27_9ACTO|nr:hypothetical protein HMPREF0388_0064 [Mobiluncus curtisii ATCC 51333]
MKTPSYSKIEVGNSFLSDLTGARRGIYQITQRVKTQILLIYRGIRRPQILFI